MPIAPLITFASCSARDLLRGPRVEDSPSQSLDAAIAWLKRAHDATPDGGVSYGYTLRGGWQTSYRETSGYIAATFFDLAKQRGDDDARERAIEIARWLPSIQNPDGGVPNLRFGKGSLVFDTGQVLLGLVRAFEETSDEQFLDAANRAAGWLVDVADEQGCWTRGVHKGVPHVYNARVAWALTKLSVLAPSDDAERVARANLDWAVSQQTEGCFENCAFVPGVAPFTHTIAYVIRGLLEAGLLLRESAYVEAATRGAEAVMRHLRSDGYLPGQIDAQGKPVGNYCCLTGNVQMSIVWQLLWARTGEEKFLNAAVESLRYVMGTQDLRTTRPEVRGAIAGSYPVWGRYSPFQYPNWATKFFIDAMLRCEGALGAEGV
jgi:uncharacterized protein YyaL (SSP411 family)